MQGSCLPWGICAAPLEACRRAWHLSDAFTFFRHALFLLICHGKKQIERRLQANAVHLSAELPVLEGGNMQVLYPSSVKAGTDLQVRLARGCDSG